MNTLLAFVVGALYAAGLYMVMRRSLVKLLIGLALLGHAANLLIFTSAGLTRGRAPLIRAESAAATAVPGGQEELRPPVTLEEPWPTGRLRPVHDVADPLPQALVLTAIVIAFGVLAFALVLMQSAYAVTRADDIDRMTTTDR